ncbi:hypothetical protein L211DRAFT_534270 [Terfezia boudieri ATCC MYA-4762]|uniref:Uncharacterized protein n=1 Tax=Terfezia boudieri ATCC MYA-4762 TaxID=1051890 RepID=A0A3N4MDD4_9PEZI|nr:hypothetical protein L211DRAFT_534270 [Terfezia boudieri ATCC MYA-4762]
MKRITHRMKLNSPSVRCEKLYDFVDDDMKRDRRSLRTSTLGCQAVLPSLFRIIHMSLLFPTSVPLLFFFLPSMTPPPEFISSRKNYSYMYLALYLVLLTTISKVVGYLLIGSLCRHRVATFIAMESIYNHIAQFQGALKIAWSTSSIP